MFLYLRCCLIWPRGVPWVQFIVYGAWYIVRYQSERKKDREIKLWGRQTDREAGKINLYPKLSTDSMGCVARSRMLKPVTNIHRINRHLSFYLWHSDPPIHNLPLVNYWKVTQMYMFSIWLTQQRVLFINLLLTYWGLQKWPRVCR